ncbi:MAG TPA: hypothetical protein VFP38_18480 [Bradyrhizobium sp.]|nr:hypothetical protein [Bradyrhizobium sp.]
MSVILLMLGIVVASAGAAAICFAIPINELILGSTLIIAGATALTGGLVLIGLSTVVSELNHLAEALRARPSARPGRPAAEAQERVAAAPFPPSSRPAPPQVPFPEHQKVEASRRDLGPAEPRQPAPSAVEVSAAAVERLRSSIPRRGRSESSVVAELEEVPLSPNGAAPHSQPARVPVAETAPEPKAEGAARAGDATAAEAPKASRLDFLFRSKPVRQAPIESFDTVWPAEGQAAKDASRDSEPRFKRSARPAAEAPPYAEPAPAPAGDPAAILKSGVVNGMAYTLYADGSIEAKLPHGTVRFGSIAELRAHIENNS